MERESGLRVLRSYLRTSGMVPLAVLLALAVIVCVLLLYGVPVEPVLYAGALCFLALAAAAVPHYLRFRRRALAVSRVLRALPEGVTALPEPRGTMEALYVQCTESLAALLAQSETERRRERSESADYYTMWVHQIKTPIAAMRLMLLESDTEENRALLAELFRVERYAEMALTYARLESPANDFVLHRVAVEPVVRAVVRQYAGQLVRRRLKLVCELEPAEVLTDEKWLSFILGQLLANAVKYTENGSVTVRCTADGVLTVTDTGIGIAPEDVPRVFEKGFTGLNGRQIQNATGLGMYLSRTAAERLSHRLTVTSKLGSGTAFTLDMRHDALWVE